MEVKNKTRKPTALLVSMPWTNVTEPSLGLSLLKSILNKNKIECRVLHLNIFLLKYLRFSTYNALAHSYALCDFLFTGVLEQKVTDSQLSALKKMLDNLIRGKIIDTSQYGGYEEFLNLLMRLRNEIFPNWLEECASEIIGYNTSFVGFTCMFDQTIASIALSKLIKEKDPGKFIALGGYAIRNPTGEMILKCYSSIDAICIGEGEHTISDLVRASTGEVSLKDVGGIIFRSENGAIIKTNTFKSVDLNSNPVPDYDDFFCDLKKLNEQNKVEIRPPVLPMENSRGCWWGEKSHCVFCGIKSSDLVYRAKEAGVVLKNMSELKNKYNINAFRYSDYILPNEYFSTLLPEIVRLGSPYHISTEMKSNITEEKFQLLATSGFIEVQPGIESFNSNVLQKMKKGVTGIQNVFTLLLGKKYKVRILYNLIFGFPNDVEEDYLSMLASLPRLAHLDPPMTYIEVKITRWAPLHMTPEIFGIEKARSDYMYKMLFSEEYLNKNQFILDDFCYYFERTFENSKRLSKLYNSISNLIDKWRKNKTQSKLYKKYSENGKILIHDYRGESEKIYSIDHLCDAILMKAGKPVLLSNLNLQDPNQEKFEKAINTLDQLGLIFMEENKILSLVLEDE